MCVAARPIQSTATALRRRNAPAMTITPLPQVVPVNREGRRTAHFIAPFATVYLVQSGLQKVWTLTTLFLAGVRSCVQQLFSFVNRRQQR